MSEQTDTRTPEEIENDIARTREDFSSTIEAIQNKLTPSELMDQAVDYALTTTPGAFSANLVNTVRDNPIPVALIGVGIAWLMTARRQSDWRAPRTRHQRAARSAGFYPDVEDAYGGAPRMSHARGGLDSGSSSEGMLQRAASKATETGQDLKDKASEVGQRLSGAASALTGRARQMGESARGRLQESTEETRARVSELGQRSQEQYYRAKDRFGQLLDEQPLVVGALGLAIGAALGGSLPTTRRENELMGRTRDDLLGRAKETARDQAETIKQSAQHVAEVAKKEAERFKENVSNAGTQDMDQNPPVSSDGMGSSQFGGASGQQSPR
ncbi:MAG: hypothetical protein JWQ23_3039 [Herminiimonas sp.]|nr:hypothetical protein [Herminiimonas sp.]